MASARPRSCGRATPWAKAFDGNFAGRAAPRQRALDAEKDLAKMKAKVLYVLSRTDKLFPPSIAPDVMAKLKAAGVTADYFEIDSDFGHSASGLDAAKWAPRLRTFMAALEKRS
jgi:homoserine O-acetyltransferase